VIFVCNYVCVCVGGQHVAVAIWPCTYLFQIANGMILTLNVHSVDALNK